MNQLAAPLSNPHWSDKRKKIVLTDVSYVKYEGNNPDEKIFSLFRIDKDNLISTKKCDYLLVSETEPKAYFIELKGRHLLEAVDQIKSSFDFLKSHLRGHEINGRIVLSRTNAPDMQSPKYVRLRKLLLDTGGDLQPQTNLLKETL